MPSPKKQQQPEPSSGGKFKLRPLEMIGLGLLGFAILVYSLSKCLGGSKPVAGPGANNQLDSTQTDSVRMAQELEKLTKIYIVMDSVKLRSTPGLNGQIVKILLFDEVVYDLKEQTQKMENIRFSAEESRKEPWVKVRTADGKVGWVFGAVVSFYRKPRPSQPMRDSSLTTGSDTTAAAPSTTPTPGRPTSQPPRNR